MEILVIRESSELDMFKEELDSMCLCTSIYQFEIDWQGYGLKGVVGQEGAVFYVHKYTVVIC